MISQENFRTITKNWYVLMKMCLNTIRLNTIVLIPLGLTATDAAIQKIFF